MKFELLTTDTGSSARAGVLHTSHGDIDTPVFMPVGTVGSVKGVFQEHLYSDIQAPIILGNTYHLYLRPGTDVLKQAGGLHKFINWPGAMLTDSGGYQVFSLAHRRKIKEEGATFQSHVDGSRVVFTPENVVDTQRLIGADIMMAFDECAPFPCEKKYAEKAMHLTHRWLDRCITQFQNSFSAYGYEQAMFPIVQGGVHADLRQKSAEYIASKHADGNAIGGLSVGEPAQDMYAITELVCGILPAAKPRYLMGVGRPENLLECIALGVDMFDCVMPTRNARHGYLFTTRGVINLRNEKWKNCFEPVDPEITPDYSLAYLRHLIISSEQLGGMIASLQNLRFYVWLMQQARIRILDSTFAAWKTVMLNTVCKRRY